MKNDGKYIYVASGSKIEIIDAFPAEEMEIIKEINLSSYISNIFLKNDKLVVLTNSYSYGTGVEAEVACVGIRGGCLNYYNDQTNVFIYDVSDKDNIELERNISVSGYYTDARLIDDYVYLISTRYASKYNLVIPSYTIEGETTVLDAGEIAYPNYPDSSYLFLSVSAIQIDGDNFANKVYLVGSSGNLFVSQDNIYFTYGKYMNYIDYTQRLVDDVYLKILPEDKKEEVRQIMQSDIWDYEKMQEISNLVFNYSSSLLGEGKASFDADLAERLDTLNKKLARESQKTVIHKININEDDIGYVGVAEVPGYVLNQFSMDEYKDKFRIATTISGNWFSGMNTESVNNLYVLDENLNIEGKLEDLAAGERIYSVRYMGERAYIVTFRQVDPLFVIDLKGEPEVLGYLKVTGYSGYLHPYDREHIIGIGMEASEEGRVQGLKIALFDVSDVENPKQEASYEISKDLGYSSTPVLYDHKAFLFDKGKNLLAIPVSISNWDSNYYWNGVYIFDIDSSSIELRGKIDHENETVDNSTTYWYWNRMPDIRRSLFMDDVLYTISNAEIRANQLDSLDEIAKVELPYNNPVIMYSGRGLESGEVTAISI